MHTLPFALGLLATLGHPLPTASLPHAAAAAAAAPRDGASGTTPLMTVPLYDSATVDPFRTQGDSLTLYRAGGGGGNGNDSLCAATTAALGGGWPTTDGGLYEVWVAARAVGPGCQLRFYDAPPGDDDRAGDPGKFCQGLTYVVRPGDAMAHVELGTRFGASHCCGDACDQPSLARWTRDVPVPDDRDAPSEAYELPSRAAPDVPAAAAPALDARRARCTFDATGDNITTYGDPQVVSATTDCTRRKTACEDSVAYSTSSTATTYKDDSMSAGISLGGSLFSSLLGFFGFDFSMSSEETTSTSNTTAWSVRHTVGIDAGTKGYVTFQPKYLCAQGVFTGHCGDTSKVGPTDWICVNAWITIGDSNIEPDGIWRVVTET